MLLLIAVLKDYRHVESLLLSFLELGITGATVLDGRGMGQILSAEVPIFAGVRGLFPGAVAESHVVFSAMTEAQAKDCVAALDKLTGGLSAPGAGVAFTLPLSGVFGLATEFA